MPVSPKPLLLYIYENLVKEVLPQAATSGHKFFEKMKGPAPPQSVIDFVLKKDIPLLRSSLPAGIYIKAFEESE